MRLLWSGPASSSGEKHSCELCAWKGRSLPALPADPGELLAGLVSASTELYLPAGKFPFSIHDEIFWSSSQWIPEAAQKYFSHWTFPKRSASCWAWRRMSPSCPIGDLLHGGEVFPSTCQGEPVPSRAAPSMLWQQWLCTFISDSSRAADYGPVAWEHILKGNKAKRSFHSLSLKK